MSTQQTLNGILQMPLHINIYRPQPSREALDLPQSNNTLWEDLFDLNDCKKFYKGYLLENFLVVLWTPSFD